MFIESISNPQGTVTDIAALAEIAHRHGVPLIVDNTVATPCLLRPFEHGADIVVHSLTKYLGGKASGLLTFGVTSAPGEGRVAGAVLDALQLFTRLVNIGHAKSLATHPDSTTHRQLSPAGLTKAGVPEDAVRLSIGMSTLTICWQIWHRRWLPFKPLRASLTGTWASSPMPPASLRCGQGRHHE